MAPTNVRLPFLVLDEDPLLARAIVGGSAAVARRPSVIRRFGLSALAVGAVVVLKLLLNPVLGQRGAFLLFTPAVMLAAWYGGLWPGLLATGLSAAFGGKVVASTGGHIAVEDWDRLALFLVVGVAVTWLQVRVSAASARVSMLLARERAARSEAEAANRLKDEFLATVSHELGGPLTAMVGWASMLRDQALDARSVRRAAEVIERNARLQQRLVEDIVDTVRASRGTMRLERQRVDLASLVAAAVDAARPTADTRGVRLKTAIQPGEHAVWGDPARLYQVLANLLGNALKFTPSGGSITVGLDRADRAVRVTVADTGAGIAPDFLPHVFEPFQKGPDSVGGLGLGLAIVRHLVETHGGTVAAESAGRGRGAVLTLTLPILEARDALAVAAPPADGFGTAIGVPVDEPALRRAWGP